jgi:capsular polysaccharide biosynthesis protein
MGGSVGEGGILSAGGVAESYGRTLRTWWWVILGVPLLAVLASSYLTRRQDPVFRSATELAVVPSPDLTEPADVMRGLETLERRTVIATFASIAETRETLGAAAARLTLEDSDVSGYRVQASVVPRTNIIRISVEGPDGERASVLANTLAHVVAEEAKIMYQLFELRQMEMARPARGPFHPDPSRNAMVAGILGLFVGLFFGLALDYVRSQRSRAPAGVPDPGEAHTVSSAVPAALAAAMRK